MVLKYRFNGDTLRLLKYELTVKRSFGDDEHDEIIRAVSENEKEELLKQYPEAEVAEIDNTGYEWLDGMIFTQEQLRAGELERAIELGEVEYKRQKQESDPEYRVSVLEEALMELASIVGGE